jgi:hypothetical protein
MLALPLALLSLLSVADAAPVVLHSESDAEAVRVDVLSATAPMDPDVAVTHLDAFRSSLAPALVGGGVLKRCTQEKVEPLGDLLKRAEGSLSYLELDKAQKTLNTAHDQLPCLQNPADPQQAARIGFLQGVIAIESEDKATAWSSFSQAVRFVPDIAWDEQFPADGNTILGLAKAEMEKTPPVKVGIVPALAQQAQVWLNGAPVPTTETEMLVPPGVNLFQVQGPQGMDGFELTVKGGTNPRLFLPSLIPDDALSWAQTDEGQKKLSAVVNQAFESGTSVIVSHDGGLWRSAAGMTTWETIRPSKGTGLSNRPRAMAWLSTGITVGLGAGTAFAWSRAAMAKKAANTANEDFEAYAATGNIDHATQKYKEGINQQSMRTRSLVSTSVGAVLTAGGIVVTIPLHRAAR